MNDPGRDLEKGRAFFLTSAFWRGFGGLFEFCKVLVRHNFSTSGANADYHALYSDWEAVGGYLRSAASEYSAGVSTASDIIENEEKCQKKTNKAESLQE